MRLFRWLLEREGDYDPERSSLLVRLLEALQRVHIDITWDWEVWALPLCIAHSRGWGQTIIRIGPICISRWSDFPVLPVNKWNANPKNPYIGTPPFGSQIHD